MINKFDNTYIKALNSILTYKFMSECKSIIYLQEDLICYGLADGEFGIFSTTSLKKIKFLWLFSDSIINIERAYLRVPKEKLEKITEDSKRNKTTLRCFVIQGKGGQLVFVKISLDPCEIQKIFEMKYDDVHNAFMKLPLNNEYYEISYKSELPVVDETQHKINFTQNNDQTSLNFQYTNIKRDYENYDELLIFLPKEDSHSINICQLSKKKNTYGEINMRGILSEVQMMSICFMKYVEIVNGTDKKIFLYVVEESGDCQLLLIQNAGNKFSVTNSLSSKISKSQIYIYDGQVLVHKEDKITILNIFLASNTTNIINVKYSIDNLKLISITENPLPSMTKPGLTTICLRECTKYLLVATSDRKIRLIRIQDMKPIATFPLHEKYINKLMIMNLQEDKIKKELLLSCSDDKDLCILNMDILKKHKL